jgi:hypothetical protein
MQWPLTSQSHGCFSQREQLVFHYRSNSRHSYTDLTVDNQNLIPDGNTSTKKFEWVPPHALEEFFRIKGGEAGPLRRADHPGHVVHGTEQPNLKKVFVCEIFSFSKSKMSDDKMSKFKLIT